MVLEHFLTIGEEMFLRGKKSAYIKYYLMVLLDQMFSDRSKFALCMNE